MQKHAAFVFSLVMLLTFGRGLLSPVVVKPDRKVERVERVVPRPSSWYLGTCAVSSNSSEWLREWIEVQLLVGVGHVWVINDNEEAGQWKATQEILELYEKMGVVTIYGGGLLPKTHPGCGGVAKCIGPKLCHEITDGHVQQLLFSYTDEFVYPTMGCDLSNFVRQNCDPFEAYTTIRWERFGSSGHETRPKGLTVENFLSSGGDCLAHTAGGHTCEKKAWDFCWECRHMRVLYNSRCVNTEHVGWVHHPTNTTLMKTHPELNPAPGTPIQPGKVSVWKDGGCREKVWGDDVSKCKAWAAGEGDTHPREPSSECCAAGIGYNHYGTGPRSRWGPKPGLEYEMVNQNNMLSSGMLRFVRALRLRFATLGLPTSPDVFFLDNNLRQSSFAERGWVYAPIIELASVRVPSPATTVMDCATSCWQSSADDGRCGAWSFNTEANRCFLIWGHYKSFKNGVDLRVKRFPHTTVPASRTRDALFVSGIPLHEGECPLPKWLQGPYREIR